MCPLAQQHRSSLSRSTREVFTVAISTPSTGDDRHTAVLTINVSKHSRREELAVDQHTSIHLTCKREGCEYSSFAVIL